MIRFADAPATCILLAANVLVFLAEERAGGSARPDVALRFGAQSLSLLRRGQWWRLGAAMFLHFGFLHLLFNMYALWNLGPPLETVFGTVPFLALYLLSGLAGNLLTWYRETRTREGRRSETDANWNGGFFDRATEKNRRRCGASSRFFDNGTNEKDPFQEANVPERRPTISAGASGAVFGLLGAYLALAVLPSNWIVDIRSLATVLILNLVYGFSNKSINMAAHLGGLLAGFLLSFLFLLFL